MTIIRTGGGMDVTRGPETGDERAAIDAIGTPGALEDAARGLLNQPSMYTPKAAAAFEAARDALATSLLDPVVSDRDTRKVIAALEPLSPREWLAAIRKLEETPAPEGNLLRRFAQRGLADSHEGIRAFMHQVLRKLGTPDAAGGISIPSDLLQALGRELGAPTEKDLSSVGRVQKEVGDAAALAAFVVVSLVGWRGR